MDQLHGTPVTSCISCSPVALTLALLLIAAATLTPSGGRAPGVGTLCLGCGQMGVPDLVLNIFIFAPLGFVLGRAGIRPLIVLGIGLLLSSSIEAIQVFLPGRAPTLRDVLTNALGCGLGGLTAVHLRAWVAPGRRAVLLLQWVPDQGHLERWKGTLREAYVGQTSVAGGPSRTSAELQASLKNSAHVRVVGVAGPPTKRLSAIFAVATDETSEVLLIGPHGHDLVVRVRRLAATWRMDAPEFRGTPQGGCATVNGVRHCVGRSTAGSTWMLARSYDGVPWWVQRLLDSLTLFVLTLPAGLLIRGAPRAHALAVGAVILVGLPTVAWYSGLALPSLWDWLGVVLAIVCGALISTDRLSASGWRRPRGRPTPR